MLVIARKVGQTVLIGEEIEITIAAVRGDQVRLAINAPRNISIVRREVLDQVARGNVAAVDSAAGVLDVVMPGSASPGPLAAGPESAGPIREEPGGEADVGALPEVRAASP